MAEMFDENNFDVTVDDKKYHVTVSYEGVYVSHYKIETDKYLATISMNEEGQWHAEDNATSLDENLVEEIGKAIEEFDVA